MTPIIKDKCKGFDIFVRISAVLFWILVLSGIIWLAVHAFSGKGVFRRGSRDYSWTENSIYICHALGGIDDRAYTNSREALERSYEKGYRNIETDFEYSSDGELVLIHNFKKKTLKELFSIETEEEEMPLSLSEFRSLKVYGEYTTMTLEELFSFMADHKDMYLILDGKYDDEAMVKKEYSDLIKLAGGKDPEILNRMVPQIYNESMYDWIQELYDWKSVIFTWYKLDDDTMDPEEIFKFCAERDIRVCTMEDEKENPLIDKTAGKYGVMVYVHTINSEGRRDRLLSSGVHGIYTDFLYD